MTINTVKDLKRYNLKTHCEPLRIPTQSKIILQKSLKIPGNDKCPAETFNLKIENENDCWELPNDSASCQDLKKIKELIAFKVIRDEDLCRYTYLFEFKEPGKYSLGDKRKISLLVQDSMININNSGGDFSVIYLHKQEDLYLEFKKDQLKKIDLYDLKGKIMYSRELINYPITTFRVDLKEIAGEKFMLSLKTELKKMRKFIILE